MAIFKNNFNNKTPSPNNTSQPECYLIVYKSPEFTLNCDGKDTVVELPVAPEQVYLSSNDPWWSINQHRIKQTIKCENISPTISDNGSGPLCVSFGDAKDCISITPDEEKLLNFLVNNNCSAPSNNPIFIWYNNIVQTYPSLSGTQKLTRSFNGECIDCNNSNLIRDHLFTSKQASIISGNNITLSNSNTINLTNYFDLSKRPLVSYSNSLSDNQDVNIIISKQLGFDKVISLDEYSQVTTQNILPGQKLQLKNNMVLGASASTGISQTGILPVPPSLLSFRNNDPEYDATTILTIAPTPRTSAEERTISYVFRFNGVAIIPSRVGPIVGGNDIPGLSANEYEFAGIWNEQYLTIAAVSSKGIGEYSYPYYLGSGCCFVEDGTIISGSEETCQEYTTDRELSYTWSNITCPSSGSWLLGTKQNEIFYPTGCTYGSYSNWLSSFNSGNARNFYPNRTCDNFPYTTQIINPSIVPTGNNISITPYPDITINFTSVSSTGQLYFNSDFDNNTFSFTTTATTTGTVGFSIPKPSSFVSGNELLSLSSNGSIISVPFNIVNDKIVCSDISQNIEYYSPENGFVDLNSLSIKETVTPAVQRTAVFYMVPSGVGSMCQYANYQAPLWNSKYGYFTDSLGKVNPSQILNSYSPSVMSSSAEDTISAQIIAIDPIDPLERPDPINFMPTLSFIPCENPFYVRGGFNLDDIWNEECGCWDLYLDRGQLISIIGTLIALLLTALRLIRFGAALLSSLAQNAADMAIQEAVAAKTDIAIEQLDEEIADIIDQLPPTLVDGGSFIVPLPDGKDLVRIDGEWFIRIPSFDDFDLIPVNPDSELAEEIAEIMDLFQDFIDKTQEKALEEDAQAKCNEEILRLFREELELKAQQDANNLTLVAVWASIAGILAIIDAWKKLPGISTRKTCAPGFDFCEWNGTYDVCGGVEEERAYWRKGYSPDGVRLTMPQGWPSCDCCHPCEPCHNPPPDGERGQVCPACPEGWLSMGLKFVGFLNGSITPPPIPDPDHCLNGETYVCCPPPDAGSPFSHGPFWGAPTTEGGSWTFECVYFRPGPPFDWVTKNYREEKRCCDGDCVDYCDDCNSI